MKAKIKKYKQYLLTGVSFAVPFIACGGILIAIAIAFAPMGPKGPDFSNSPILKHILTIGETAFGMLLPILAGYVAYAMAGKPGLVAGFVGGGFANMTQMVDGKETNAGFLGALLAGLLAGTIVNWCKKIPTNKMTRPLLPIIIIPVLSTLAIGTIMTFVNMPMAQIMAGLGNWLESMQSGSAVLLAIVLGAMIAFDMGGPVNKAAFFFAAAMIQQGNYAPMGAVATAICIPPIGLGLATMINKKLWSEQDKESGIAALGMGMVGITEGAIPFAASDPVRIIPCIMGGSIVGAVISMLSGVGGHAPHGGPIVLPVADNPLMFAVAIIAGAVTTAVLINTWKKISKNKEAAVADAK